MQPDVCTPTLSTHARTFNLVIYYVNDDWRHPDVPAVGAVFRGIVSRVDSPVQDGVTASKIRNHYRNM